MQFAVLKIRPDSSSIGPCPPKGPGLFAFDQTFGKFYLIRTGFTFGELVSLVKVFRLFKLEQMFFWCSERVWTE
jgi:hypothetical protein